MASSPFPQLQIQPLSGLSFPWAEYHPDPSVGSFAATLGSDGVTLGMKMLIFWEDLNTACRELLGYSWRDPSPPTPAGTPFLRRHIPWQHPYWNQLYVKRIAEVRGLTQQGKNSVDPEDSFNPSAAAVGAGYIVNLGPWTEYFLAELTIQFWRPPYYIRSDADILDANGNPQEWLRYVSKTWAMSLNMLSRENSSFMWLPGQKPPKSSKLFPGSVGQTVTHNQIARTWYQIPEQALFASLVDATPNGLPNHMLYTQTPTENPLSLFDQAAGTSTTMPSSSVLAGAVGYTYPAGSPLGGCVNAAIGGQAVDNAGNWVDLTIASRFFGCYTGTLRFDGVTFTPQPLQLPAYLMQIPTFAGNEAISQTQYDVTFHFDLFDPPPGGNPAYGTPVKGHNLFPFSGNGLWYPLLSQNDIDNGTGTTSGPKLTPFMYADFTDLFRIL